MFKYCTRRLTSRERFQVQISPFERGKLSAFLWVNVFNQGHIHNSLLAAIRLQLHIFFYRHKTPIFVGPTHVVGTVV